MELLSVCEHCSSYSDVEIHNIQGAYVKFRCICTNSKCCHTRFWETSNKHNGRPLINILLSAVILFSGSLPAKFLRAMTMLCVLCPSPVTFFQHQRDYLHGVSFVKATPSPFFSLKYLSVSNWHVS